MKVNLNDASDSFIMNKAAGASPTNGKKHVNNNNLAEAATVNVSNDNDNDGDVDNGKSHIRSNFPIESIGNKVTLSTPNAVTSVTVPALSFTALSPSLTTVSTENNETDIEDDEDYFNVFPAQFHPPLTLSKLPTSRPSPSQPHLLA